MYEKTEKKGNEKTSRKITWDKGTVVATILAVTCVFEAIQGDHQGMAIVATPLSVFFGSKKINRDEVIEELNELYRRRKNKK